MLYVLIVLSYDTRWTSCAFDFNHIYAQDFVNLVKCRFISINLLFISLSFVSKFPILNVDTDVMTFNVPALLLIKKAITLLNMYATTELSLRIWTLSHL